MTITNEALQQGAQRLVTVCANVKSKEHILILSTEATQALAVRVQTEALKIASNVSLMVLPETAMHGNEPSDTVAGAMFGSDIVFCMTPMSMAHTDARKKASSNRTRFLSLPDYDESVMASYALTYDFAKLESIVNSLADVLDPADSVRITSVAGTDCTISLAGRLSNRCPGFVRHPGELGSPPDAEINLAPVEGSAEGILVVDGSVPCREVGVLPKPVSLRFEGGRVCEVFAESNDMKSYVDAINKLFDDAVGTGPGDPRMLGEFGIGLNPYSKLCGSMLEDEGAYRTAHFGIGSNATIGGLNSIPFHLDFIFREPDVVTNTGQRVLESGNLVNLKIPT